jgi:hypothetical protein
MTTLHPQGFEITLHDPQRLVSIRIWGDWDAEFAGKYGDALEEKIADIREHDREWCVLVDLTAFAPRSEDARQIVRQQTAAAGKQRMKKIAYVGAALAAQLRFNKHVRETETPSCACFESHADALQWLLSQ